MSVQEYICVHGGVPKEGNHAEKEVYNDLRDDGCLGTSKLLHIERADYTDEATPKET